MKTILVIAEKGGVGKTMLADEIMFSLERSGIRAAFYEFDRQGGELHTGAPITDPEVNVVDTPGFVLEGRDAWIEDADVVVIPTVAGGKAEMQPFISTLVACCEKGKQVAVVFNKKQRRFNTSKALEKALKELPFRVTLLSIPMSEDLPNASLKDMSVVQYRKRGDAAKAVLTTVNEIRKMAGVDPEE
ncbi:MAG: chromosome partitioning protein [Parasporobacterium sp.]|nr:chromosome partitioning protein [Parasporobacterium sp.]